MAIGRNRLSLIKVAVARLSLDDDAYRALLDRAAGVSSARDLDDTGFRRVMDEFRRLGFVSTFSEANLGGRLGMATPAQVATLRRLWHRWTDGQGTETSLGTWLDNKFGVSALRFLTKAKASKAIGGLKAMVTKRRAA